MTSRFTCDALSLSLTAETYAPSRHKCSFKTLLASSSLSVLRSRSGLAHTPALLVSAQSSMKRLR